MLYTGIRQTQIEEDGGLGRGTMSRFLHGKYSDGTGTSMAFLLAVADVLNVDLGWLVTGRTPDKTKCYPDLALHPVPALLPRGRPWTDEPRGWVARSRNSEPRAAVRKKRRKKH